MPQPTFAKQVVLRIQSVPAADHDTVQFREFIMLSTMFARFSFSTWFFDAWSEMVRYFNTMNTMQWGVLSACAVAFGFLCLRGSGVNR